MSYTPTPENMRTPQHLSETALRQALEELDAKIQTLRNRAHATTVNSTNTYHQHADALEAKRARLLQQLGPAKSTGTNAAASEQDRSAWGEIWRGIENLRDDLRNII